MEPIIEVKHLSKRYIISHERGSYLTLRDVLANIIKHPFSAAKNKAKQVVGLEKREEFWALKDVSFNVEKGEVIGIIGANGAGKSTLLKILSQITPPTEGEIILRGKVGSLLEVGTGFHPELTGRENIFLNGAILGMTRKNIIKNFDKIVEFAGIGKFLDTPVKRYSSGMYVRLAFSVAAHMEPDILIVDEVLAVGDAEFQKKCLGKMEEVSSKAGRTILFVSHNLSAIERLCKKTILLKNGRIEAIGPTAEVIAQYVKTRESVTATYIIPPPFNAKSLPGLITKIQVEDEHNSPADKIPVGRPWRVRIFFTLTEVIPNFSVAFSMHTLTNVTVRTTWSKFESLTPGNYEATVEDDKVILNSGIYAFNIGILVGRTAFHYIADCGSLQISPENADVDPNRVVAVGGSEIIIGPMDISITKR